MTIDRRRGRFRHARHSLFAHERRVKVTGFVTRKHLENKPSGVGDVVLGFDPYRFDHASMRAAIRWVLGEHFGLSMSP